MKKLLCLLCAILIISSLVACNSNEENNSSYGVETNVSHQEQPTENSTEMIEPDLLDTTGKDAVENGETTKDDIQTEDELQTIVNNDVETELINQNEGNRDFYNICTSYSKVEVEDFMLKVQQLVLEKKWEKLSEYVAYPITMFFHLHSPLEIVVDNKDDFAEGSFASDISKEFYTAIEQASSVDMFCNWQGIMLGAGEIWVSEVLNDDGTSQGLKIRAFNIN